MSSVTAPSGAASENSPRSFVSAVIGVPATATDAPATGSAVAALITFPRIGRCWAAAQTPTTRLSASETNETRDSTIPPDLVTPHGTKPQTPATLRAISEVRKEGCSRRDGGGRRPAPPQGRIHGRPRHDEQQRDQNTRQPDRPALHLEHQSGDEYEQRQRRERHEPRDAERHPEGAPQRRLRAPQPDQRRELEPERRRVQEHVAREQAAERQQ